MPTRTRCFDGIIMQRAEAVEFRLHGGLDAMNSDYIPFEWVHKNLL